MKPESRTRLIPATCFIVVFAVVVASIFYISTTSAPQNLPTTLPILAGTVVHFPAVGTDGVFRIRFILTEPGRMVGSWYADRGGEFVVDWVNDTHPYPGASMCAAPWNGTIDWTFPPGVYTMGFWGAGLSGNLTVTETIQIVYPASVGPYPWMWGGLLVLSSTC